jgi:hypothetical protein
MLFSITALLGKIDYDLVILGNKITPKLIRISPTVYVDGVRDIDFIGVDQDLSVGPYLFNVRYISIKRKDTIAGRDTMGNINSLRDIDTHEIWLNIYEYPEIIELADGTEIRFPIEMLEKYSLDYWLIVHKTDTWIISSRKYVDEEDHISVKLPVFCLR